MHMKGWAVTLGIGAAAGAVAVMMLPKQCTARKVIRRWICKKTPGENSPGVSCYSAMTVT